MLQNAVVPAAHDQIFCFCLKSIRHLAAHVSILASLIRKKIDDRESFGVDSNRKPAQGLRFGGSNGGGTAG
jgi:hypothetical protein